MFKKEIEQINNFYENVKDSIGDENLIIFSICYNVMLAKLRCPSDDYAIKSVKDIDKVTINLIEKIEFNIQRFFKEEKIKIDFTEVGFNLTEETKIDNQKYFNQCFGDLDYLTNKGILDLKCLSYDYRYEHMNRAIAQQIIYVYMGRYGINDHKISHDYFFNIDNVGYYNPITDMYFYFDIVKNQNICKKVVTKSMIIPLLNIIKNRKDV